MKERVILLLVIMLVIFCSSCATSKQERFGTSSIGVNPEEVFFETSSRRLSQEEILFAGACEKNPYVVIGRSDNEKMDKATPFCYQTIKVDDDLVEVFLLNTGISSMDTIKHFFFNGKFIGDQIKRNNTSSCKTKNIIVGGKTLLFQEFELGDVVSYEAIILGEVNKDYPIPDYKSLSAQVLAGVKSGRLILFSPATSCLKPENCNSEIVSELQRVVVRSN